METLFATMLSLAAASATLLSQVPTNASPEVIESAMEMRLIMVPLIGGIFTMLGAVFLNPSVETTQIKVGRACLGMFAAVIMPQVIGYFFPSIKDIGTNPFMLLAFGGMFAFLGFIFSRPAVQGIYNRSGRLAERALDQAEKKYFPNNHPEP